MGFGPEKVTAVGICYGEVSDKETPRERPFAAPSENKFFDGYGADQSDLKRGYCDPDIQALPKYDKANYGYRSSEPGRTNDDMSVQKDYEFRNINRESQGFLTRPRIPTER